MCMHKLSVFIKRLERVIMKKTPRHYRLHILMPSLRLETIKMSTYTWKAVHGKESSGKPQSNSDCFPLWQWSRGLFLRPMPPACPGTLEVRDPSFIICSAYRMLHKATNAVPGQDEDQPQTFAQSVSQPTQGRLDRVKRGINLSWPMNNYKVCCSKNRS